MNKGAMFNESQANQKYIINHDSFFTLNTYQLTKYKIKIVKYFYFILQEHNTNERWAWERQTDKEKEETERVREWTNHYSETEKQQIQI